MRIRKRDHIHPAKHYLCFIQPLTDNINKSKVLFFVFIIIISIPSLLILLGDEDE